MKLLRSWPRTTDSLTAYFDPATRTVYDIYDTDGKFDVRAFEVSRGEMALMQALSADFATEAEALTELDRIAALIEGKAPAQGWVAGAPPLVDGAWFLALDVAGQPVAVTYAIPKNSHPWETAGGNDVYCAEDFTHHLPTPIQPPKES